MSTRVNPPRIPNSEYQKHLGSGGFADVYLYRQRMPERDIAVKVIRPDASAEENGAFEAETNLMAKMSAHPSILSVFGAGVSEDDRSYLIMEYCPPPHMGLRAKKQQLPVPKVLDVGIRIAGAVETLHRSGILHRDIKPANILVSQFGHPVLTDFGIAVSTQAGAEQADSGFSVPWAPPEQATGQGPFGPQMDVYSLAATIHTLLTGRSPFEIPGGDNREIAMLNRVLRAPVPKTGRSDVPPELERVLAVAMAKDPSHRYTSMMDFALALQQVQTDMHQRTTPIDVLEDRVVDEVSDDDDDATRIRAFTTIDPDGITSNTRATQSGHNLDDDATRATLRQIDADPAWSDSAEVDDATRIRSADYAAPSHPQWAPASQRFAGGATSSIHASPYGAQESHAHGMGQNPASGQQSVNPPREGLAPHSSVPAAPTTSQQDTAYSVAASMHEQGKTTHQPGDMAGVGSAPVAPADTGMPTRSTENPAYGAAALHLGQSPTEPMASSSTGTAGTQERTSTEGAGRVDLPPNTSEHPVPSIGKILAIVIGSVILILALAFGVWTWLRAEGNTINPDSTQSVEAPDALPTNDNLKPVTNLKGKVLEEEVEFTWDAAEGNVSYLYRLVDPLENHPVREAKEPIARVKKLDARTCIEVIIRAKGGKTSDSAIECVDTP